MGLALNLTPVLLHINLVIALESLSFWNYQFLPISLAMDVACKKSGAGLSSLLTPYLYDKTNRLDLIFYLIHLFLCTVC